MKCINCSNSVDNKDEIISYTLYPCVGGYIKIEHQYGSGQKTGGYEIQTYFTPLRKYKIFTSICSNCTDPIKSEHEVDKEKEKEGDLKDFKRRRIIFFISLIVALLCILIFPSRWYIYIIFLVITGISGLGALLSRWSFRNELNVSIEAILDNYIINNKKLVAFCNYIYEKESPEGIIFKDGFEGSVTTRNVSMLILYHKDKKFDTYLQWLSYQGSRHWYIIQSHKFGFNADGEYVGFKWTYNPFKKIFTESSEHCLIEENEYIKNTIGLIQGDGGIQQCDVALFNEDRIKE